MEAAKNDIIEDIKESGLTDSKTAGHICEDCGGSVFDCHHLDEEHPAKCFQCGRYYTRNEQGKLEKIKLKTADGKIFTEEKKKKKIKFKREK